MTTENRQKLSPERVLGVAALLAILVCWYLGMTRENASIEPYLNQLVPTAEHFEKLGESGFAAYHEAPSTKLLAYVMQSEADGYGGPLRTLVGVSPEGAIIDLVIVKDRETPSYLQRVLKSTLVSQIIGAHHDDPLQVGEDIDGVSGATYSCNAIVLAAQRAVRANAAENLSLTVIEEAPPQIVFGIRELILIALYIAAFIGLKTNGKAKILVRWGTMLLGLLALGFVFNSPLTLALVSSLLLGHVPDVRTHLYSYLLLGGIVVMLLASKKKLYCDWFCPFGAAQECVYVLGQKRISPPAGLINAANWARCAFVLACILIALLLRHPGVTSYELFTALFTIRGNAIQFVLLVLVLLTAYVIRRPWCRFLCPHPAIADFLLMIRRWTLESWRTHSKR